jgi:CRISPR-associated protein Cas2
MKYVIAFDIVDDRIRSRVVKILSEYAYRVQKSVFEGLISREASEEMQEKLARVIDQKSDSVRIYPLCGKCEPEVRIIGIGSKVEQVDYIIL